MTSDLDVRARRHLLRPDGQEDVTAPDDAHRAARLSNLSATLRARFRHGGARRDLDHAETAIRLAVETTPSDDRRRAGRLANLAAVLLARFDVSGEGPVLDEALAASRASIAATRGDDVDLPGRLSNLVALLLTGFERGGSVQTWMRRSRSAAGPWGWRPAVSSSGG